MRQPAPMPAGVPNCVRRWYRAACIVWLAIAAPARAEDVLDVPAACGSRAELEHGIAELLGDAGTRAARPTVAMRRAGDEYVLQVQLEEGGRTLRDRDCRALFRAAVLIAALGREALIGLEMTDAGVRTGAEAGTEAVPVTGAGAVAGAGTAPATATGAGTETGATTAPGAGAGTATGVGNGTPTIAGTSAKRGRGTGTATIPATAPGTATASTSDPTTATGVPSPAPPSPRARETRMGALVNAGLAYGVVPDFTLAVGAGVYLERGWFGGRFVASYQLPQSHHDGDEGVRSDALGASATLELLATHWLKAGVGGDFYVMHGRGLGDVPSARRDWATLGTLHAALGARLYGRGRWAFEALARGLFAPQPARFEVRGGNTLFTTARLGFQLALGWGWRFL